MTGVQTCALPISAKDEAFIAKVVALADKPLQDAYQIRSKQARTQATRAVTAGTIAALQADGTVFDKVNLDNVLFDIEARIVRSQILSGEPRIDGRDTRTVRQIEIRNGVLPRAHAPGFAGGERRHVVVHHEMFGELTGQCIDALRVACGAECGNDQGLGFATREQC